MERVFLEEALEIYRRLPSGEQVFQVQVRPLLQSLINIWEISTINI